MNNLKALSTSFFESTLRVEKILLLAAMLGADSSETSEELVRFLIKEEEDVIKKCFPDLPEAFLNTDDQDDVVEEFSEWAYRNNKFGFLVQFSTPVMQPTSKSARLFSWGHYRSQWFYADTLEEAIDMGKAWLAECRKKEDAAANLIDEVPQPVTDD